MATTLNFSVSFHRLLVTTPFGRSLQEVVTKDSMTASTTLLDSTLFSRYIQDLATMLNLSRSLQVFYLRPLKSTYLPNLNPNLSSVHPMDVPFSKNLDQCAKVFTNTRPILLENSTSYCKTNANTNRKKSKIPSISSDQVQNWDQLFIKALPQFTLFSSPVHLWNLLVPHFLLAWAFWGVIMNYQPPTRSNSMRTSFFKMKSKSKETTFIKTISSNYLNAFYNIMWVLNDLVS